MSESLLEQYRREDAEQCAYFRSPEGQREIAEHDAALKAYARSEQYPRDEAEMVEDMRRIANGEPR